MPRETADELRLGGVEEPHSAFDKDMSAEPSPDSFVDGTSASSGERNGKEEARPQSKSTSPPLARPYWVPDGVSFESLDPALRRAYAAVIEPLYDEYVLKAEDALERAAGITLVHLTWLELRGQVDLEKELSRLGRNPEPESRDNLIARHVRLAMAKLKAGGFLCRLQAFRQKYGNEFGAMEILR